MPSLSEGFTRLNVYPVYPDKVYMDWVLGPDSAPGSYGYTIYRSGSPEGPWEKVNSHPLPGNPTFTDVNVDLLSKYREVYYYVEALAGNSTLYRSPIKNLVRLVDRRTYVKAVEINRMEMKLLRQYAGVEVHIFKKKHFGERCGCYESTTGTLLVKNCPECAGTGFIGGYYNSIKTYANITADRKVSLESSELKQEPMVANGWMTAYPITNVHDILVEADTNRRWVIREVQNTELRRYVVKQTLVMRELPRSDVEYSLALDYCIGNEPLLNEIPDHGRPGSTQPPENPAPSKT